MRAPTASGSLRMRDLPYVALISRMTFAIPLHRYLGSSATIAMLVSRRVQSVSSGVKTATPSLIVMSLPSSLRHVQADVFLAFRLLHVRSPIRQERTSIPRQPNVYSQRRQRS